MKKTWSKRNLWFIILNLFIFLSTMIVSVATLTADSIAGQVEIKVTAGWMYIATFTVLSNFLLGIVALFAVIYGIRFSRTGKEIPKTLIIWYLVAASSTMLTALTVLLFLAPLRALRGKDYFLMLSGPMFFFHFLNPIIASICYVFLAPKTQISKKSIIYCIVPPLIYGVMYGINVVLLHAWHDFYGFTFGGQNWTVAPVFAVILLVTYGMGYLLDLLRSRHAKKIQTPHED